MIAIDTNVLVAAHRADHPHHRPADEALREICLAGIPWALPWPCAHEFLGNVTHPRIWLVPTPRNEALEALNRWQQLPFVRMLAEGEGYWPLLREPTRGGGIVGPRIHDVRVAALCLHHGVRELWTADRDFSRFPKLRTRNPLV